MCKSKKYLLPLMLFLLNSFVGIAALTYFILFLLNHDDIKMLPPALPLILCAIYILRIPFAYIFKRPGRAVFDEIVALLFIALAGYIVCF